ncbi:NAD(P)H-dependent oxidoreductase [Lacticigenium naphthae]|uniref:NAD(P)H-dependent oxidoreductase n=1 Tax=Lacticigenium naphthae TaxID=515351 RepID=UPI0004026794|nr:NAD(P)H-dependent oxidoreductase [Lacticigenium naphthae]
MKTLLLISHPEIEDSGSQQYLLQSLPSSAAITVRHLDTLYSDGKIDREKEQAMLLAHDRILFQFPFYWYSTPSLLKKWQDEVLTEDFAYGKQKNLTGKEFGLVISVGIKETEYQAGGREGFTVNELVAPLRALANKLDMQYVKPLIIYQFHYLSERDRMRLLIKYQQYLTRQHPDSLKKREDWLVEQVQETNRTTISTEGWFILEQALSIVEDHRLAIDELAMLLDAEGEDY